MHLAPLTGIETEPKTDQMTTFAMHLAPLTGIETFDHNRCMFFWMTDASRAPYGD